MASTRVVLPWSTWAMMAMLRMGCDAVLKRRFLSYEIGGVQMEVGAKTTQLIKFTADGAAFSALPYTDGEIVGKSWKSLRWMDRAARLNGWRLGSICSTARTTRCLPQRRSCIRTTRRWWNC